MDNNIRNNVFAFVNQNNFTAGADFGSGANCLDEDNDTATAFRSAAIASGETDPALNLPTHGRFFFEKNILFNSFRNFGNASWGPNWGVPAKVSLLPRIRYEGVMMVGTGGLWASSFESNLYWSDGAGADPPGSVIAQRGFPCNASNPPGQNWPACSFESWQQSGRDKGGLVTDPMFVDPARRDFRLQAGSPARAMGIASITPSVGPRPHTPMKLDDSHAWHESRRLPLDHGVTVAIGSAHRSVQAGGTIAVVATVAGLPAGGSARLWPFANAKQWGAYCTVYHPSTNCTLLLPLPTAGDVPIRVAALAKAPIGPHGPRFPVGASLPPDALAVSAPVSVQVQPRLVRYARTGARTRVMMEWETWFTDSNMAADGFMYVLRQIILLSPFRSADLCGGAGTRLCPCSASTARWTPTSFGSRFSGWSRRESPICSSQVVMLSRFVALSVALTLNVSPWSRIGQTTCGETVIGAADPRTRKSW